MPKPGRPLDTKQETALEQLNHAVRNGIGNIEGCLREAEDNLKLINQAVKEYKQSEV